MQCVGSVDRLLERHPHLGTAVYHLAEAVITKADQDTELFRSIPRQNNQYAIDGILDDDEEDEVRPPRPQTHRVSIRLLYFVFHLIAIL